MTEKTSEQNKEQELETLADKEKEPLGLEDQLAEAQAQAAEYLAGWQRARAELANYKRRTEAQRAEMVISANAGLLSKLLPVLDDLQLALENTPEDATPAWLEWRDGIGLVAHKYLTVLENVGVKAIETQDREFDPTVHEAISHEPHLDFESGQIIGQIRPGYKLGDRVLRAAMVRVAQ